MSNVNLEYKEDITKKIIKALEKGKAPWQKPWIDNMPVNAVTDNYYQGINSIILSVEGDKLSEDGDPRWATRKQAESKGWSIKEGAKPTKIFVLILPKKVTVHSSLLNRDVVVGDKRSAFKKTFEVYHASQIRGIPLFMKSEREAVMSNETLDKIVFHSSARWCSQSTHRMINFIKKKGIFK